MRIASDGLFQFPVTYADIPIAPEWRKEILSYDIIQCLDYYTFGANACRAGHRKVVAYINENVPFNSQYVGHALENKNIVQECAVRLVATSRSVVDCLLIEGVPAEKIVDCPIWTTPACFKPTFTPTDDDRRAELRKSLDLPDRPVVLYVGRLSWAKGLKIAEEALKGLDVTWLLIGAHESYHPPDWTCWIQHLNTPEELIPYYMVADVLILPSLPTLGWVEQYGRVLVEAQACGCPVIASDLGGPRDLVVNNETGFLVPPGNPASLRGAIRVITEQKSRRDYLRKGARKWYCKKFATKKIEKRLQAIYTDVMKIDPAW